MKPRFLKVQIQNFLKVTVLDLPKWIKDCQEG